MTFARIIILSFFITSVKAQFGGSVFPFLEIHPFMKLEVNTTNNKDIEFVFNNDQQLLNGVSLNNGLNVKIKSNRNWQLNVSSQGDFFVEQSNNSQLISATVLSIKKQTDAIYKNLSASPVILANGGRGSDKKSGNFFSLDLKATPGLDYEGGDYMLNLIFTLSPD